MLNYAKLFLNYQAFAIVSVQALSHVSLMYSKILSKPFWLLNRVSFQSAIFYFIQLFQALVFQDLV